MIILTSKKPINASYSGMPFEERLLEGDDFIFDVSFVGEEEKAPRFRFHAHEVTLPCCAFPLRLWPGWNRLEGRRHLRSALW